MNSFPPQSQNDLSSFPPIESDIWCDNLHAQSSNSNNQHDLSNFILPAGKQENDNSALGLNIPTNELKISSIEHQYTKNEDLTMEFCSFNDFEFNQEASSSRCQLQLQNMMILPNPIATGIRIRLGANFRPSNYNVICGRGKRAYNHVGNRRFKLIIAMNLRKYADTNVLNIKSEIVDTVVNQIREATGSTNGTGFLRVDSAGNWYDVGIEEAREKTARAFRDYSTTGSLGVKGKNADQSTTWDDARKRRIREMQNSIFKSCQIKFSG